MTRNAKIFSYQFAHFVCLAVLLAGIALASQLPGFAYGEFLGVATPAWVYWSIANAVVHQVFVWACWRSELHGAHLTGLLGPAAFTIYAAIFTILIAARPVLVTCLAISNSGTLPIPPDIGMGIAAVLAIPVVYLAYSVHRYFGFRRAFGIDHFDAAYRALPMVRDGIFRLSGNAMYVFGFMLLWIPAFWFGSVTALVIAGFSHLYIWVHFHFTEKPDMQVIYGSDA